MEPKERGIDFEEIRVRDTLFMRGLRTKGMIVVSQDRRTGELVLVGSGEVRRKWLLFNLPQGMWRMRGSREEVLEAARRLLEERILPS